MRKNDIGGDDAGPIDRTERPVRYWEMESDALRKALGADPRSSITLDELRRAMEDLDQEAYDAGFFSRRIAAMEVLLIEKGILSKEAVAERMESLKAAAE
jgi:hypothetical protein